jgi:hypothetical protein
MMRTMRWGLLLAAVFCSAVSGAGPAKIRFDQTIFSFGTATEGDEVAGRFTFHNAGEADLNIRTPETSCGCTVASVKPDTLRPGESGEITFKLDLTNARGAVGKTITVPSNDPQQSSVTLMITGSVAAVYGFSPPMVFFGDTMPGETNQQTIAVKRLDDKPLKISKAEFSKNYLRATIVPETNSPSRAARLLIEAKATGEVEEFSDILSVFMEGSDKPAFLIPVAGRLMSAIQLVPETVVWNIRDPAHWPGANPETAQTRTLVVTATHADRPFNIGDFSSSFEDLMVKVVELEKGRKFQVSLKLTQAPRQTTQGVLSFETTIREQPNVTVPLVIQVEQP